MKRPELSDCEWMTEHPPGSIGYKMDMETIAEILIKCRVHGWRRYPQLVKWIEEMMAYQDFEVVKERALKERAELDKLWNAKRIK